MNWWQRLRRREQVERELDAELRYHLDRRAADLGGQGWSDRDARRQARMELGGLEQMKEECRDARGTRWLDDLWQDLRHGLRVLRQRPGFTAIALGTLALGSGAATVMFAVVHGVLLKPLAYPAPERLMTVHDWTERDGEQQWFSYLNFLDIRQESRTLSPVAAWRYGGGTISQPGDAEYVDGLQISSAFFDALGVPMVEGREFRADEDRPGGAPVAIISRALWKRRYDGRRNVVGSRLVFDGEARTVVGIAPPAYPPVAGSMDVFTPLGQNAAPFIWNREAHPGIRVVARVDAAATAAAANAELALIGHDLGARYPSTNADRWFTAQPLARDVVGKVRPTLWILLGAVGLVLLIACVNVASLLLARALSRERELAMRAALGATRGRLIRQCLTESALLALAGGVLGIGLATVGIRPFVALWPGGLPRLADVQIDWRVLLVALNVSVAAGMLFGLAPALRIPRHLDRALRADARCAPGGSRRLHGVLVAAEIGLAIVLLVAAGMLGRTILTLSSLDPGVTLRNALAARVALSPGALGSPASMRRAWQDVLGRARDVPGVRAAALADIVPMRQGENTMPYSTTAARLPRERMPVALASTVTPDYLAVMGLPLRRGRFFDEHDRLDTEPVVVIDEVLARRAFGNRNPVGERLWILDLAGSTPVRIIGEVGHVRHWGLALDDGASVRDQMYYPFAQVPDALMRPFSTFMSLTVRTSVDPTRVIEPLQRAMRGPANDQALYEVRTMEQLARASLARQRFLLVLFALFAGLALLLASIGIYGVLAYLTERRVPELGVRMALGATAGHVMRLVLRQSLGMILAGVVGGTAAALAGSRLLVRFVEGVQPADALTVGLVIGCLVAAALAASFVPARRASRLDALKALRQE